MFNLDYIPRSMKGFRNFSFVSTSDFYSCFVALNLTKRLKLIDFIPLPYIHRSIIKHDPVTNTSKGSNVTNLLHKPLKKLTLSNTFPCLSQRHVDNTTTWKISHSLCCKAATFNPKWSAQLNTISK